MNANKHSKYSIDTLQFPKSSFSDSTFFLREKIQLFTKRKTFPPESFPQSSTDTTRSTDKYPK